MYEEEEEEEAATPDVRVLCVLDGNGAGATACFDANPDPAATESTKSFDPHSVQNFTASGNSA